MRKEWCVHGTFEIKTHVFKSHSLYDSANIGLKYMYDSANIGLKYNSLPPLYCLPFRIITRCVL